MFKSILRFVLKRLFRVELRGDVSVFHNTRTLIVANHVSWLDIFVINAACPAAFISKAEVRDWPLVGWLAARNETVFLRRGSRGHARIVNADIALKSACRSCRSNEPSRRKTTMATPPRSRRP